MKRRTVISMEQALSLSYATLRFVQLGWRVIRLESTPIGTAQEQWHRPGDPNRYIGEVVVDDDRRSYFVAPNVGKEAIALNLKPPQCSKYLKPLIAQLSVDLFFCSATPTRSRPPGV